MAQAKSGDTVKVNYTGKLDDGTIFDSSENRDPLEFTIGEGQVIPGFESGVEGMSPGESKTITIASEQAYGPHHDELVMKLDRGAFPDDMELQEGCVLQLRHPSGEAMMALITEASDESVTLDANHPLAGKDLIFDVTLDEIKSKIIHAT